MTSEEIEVERLRLEQRKQQIEEERLSIDRDRATRDARFFRANIAIIITALVSIATLAASFWQFNRTQAREARRHQQERDKHERDVQSRLDDQKLKILEYLSTHRDGLFSDDSRVKHQYRTIMLTGIPRDSLPSVFEQLRQSPGGETIWRVGTVKYNWRTVGTGDCSGRDVGSSEGATPTIARCEAGFEGRIAVCWDGKSLTNGGNKQWCTYKSATPETCTGGLNRGHMFQCGSIVE